MKKSLIIGCFLIFLASILLVYITMANCGLNQFFITMGCGVSAQSCGGIDLGHIAMMRSLLATGLISAVIIFIWLLFRQKILSLFEVVFERNLRALKLFKSNNILGRLKPFDPLLLAYSAGIIQPKTF